MKLDAHPKAMAFIMLSIGLLGIGVILTLGFYTSNTLLGVGITMAILGGASSILGCVHLAAQGKGTTTSPSSKPCAPPRVPPIEPIRERLGESSRAAATSGQLAYVPYSASPSPGRDVTGAPLSAAQIKASEDRGNGFGGGVVGIVPPPPSYVSTTKIDDTATPSRRQYAQQQQQLSAAAFPLSPFDERSFPVPAGLAGGSVMGSQMRKRPGASYVVNDPQPLSHSRGGSVIVDVASPNGYTAEEAEREANRLRYGNGGAPHAAMTSSGGGGRGGNGGVSIAMFNSDAPHEYDDEDRLPSGYQRTPGRR